MTRIGLFKHSDFPQTAIDEDIPFMFIDEWELVDYPSAVDLANKVVQAIDRSDTGTGGDQTEAALQAIYDIVTGGYADGFPERTIVWFSDEASAIPWDAGFPTIPSLYPVTAADGVFDLNTAWLDVDYRYGLRGGTYYATEGTAAPASAASFPETVEAVVDGGWKFMSMWGFGNLGVVRSGDFLVAPGTFYTNDPDSFGAVMARITGTYKVGGVNDDEVAVWYPDNFYWLDGTYPYEPPYLDPFIQEIAQTYQSIAHGQDYIAILVDGSGSFASGISGRDVIHQILTAIFAAAGGGAGWGSPITSSGGGTLSKDGRYYFYPPYGVDINNGGYLTRVSTWPRYTDTHAAMLTGPDSGAAYLYLRRDPIYNFFDPDGLIRIYQTQFDEDVIGTGDLLDWCGFEIQVLGQSGGLENQTLTCFLIDTFNDERVGTWNIPLIYGDLDADEYVTWELSLTSGPGRLGVQSYLGLAKGEYAALEFLVTGGSGLGGSAPDGVGISFVAQYIDYVE